MSKLGWLPAGVPFLTDSHSSHPMKFGEEVTDDTSSVSIRLKCLMPTHRKQCGVEARLARHRVSMRTKQTPLVFT
jgi:hypothetical protein